tara:strand:+ start:18009 stop:18392 length:384 start_codon:yes stop_codon:yes gene_type:complete
MEFILAIKYGLNNYFRFKGKSSKANFWWFQLFIILGFFISVILDKLLFGIDSFSSENFFGLIGNLWGLFIIVPFLSIGTRRIHDIGKNGWWQLLLFLIIIGWIILIFWYCEETREDDPAKRAIGIPQ